MRKCKPSAADYIKKIYANIENKILPTESIKRMIAFASGPRNQLLLKILYFQTLRVVGLLRFRGNKFFALVQALKLSPRT